MLYEIPHIRQENHPLTKRWFTSSEMELFVWLQDSAPVRLQLCIDKQNHEQAIDRGGGVPGMDLVAAIRNPDGSVNRRTLFDDGNHGDGDAGPGYLPKPPAPATCHRSVVGWFSNRRQARRLSYERQQIL